MVAPILKQHHFFGCDESLIRKSYSESLTKGRDKGKIRLRQLMWRTAENGNVTMQIWLSKQYLGMSDKQEVTTTELPKGFDTHHIEQNKENNPQKMGRLGQVNNTTW